MSFGPSTYPRICKRCGRGPLQRFEFPNAGGHTCRACQREVYRLKHPKMTDEQRTKECCRCGQNFVDTSQSCTQKLCHDCRTTNLNAESRRARIEPGSPVQAKLMPPARVQERIRRAKAVRNFIRSHEPGLDRPVVNGRVMTCGGCE